MSAREFNRKDALTDDDSPEIEVRCGRTVHGEEDRLSHEASCPDCKIVGMMCSRKNGCGAIFERRAVPAKRRDRFLGER
jgi:hypothetical protein